MEDKGKHICPETKSEVCAFHRVEIERRRTDRGGIQDLKRKLEADEAELTAYKKDTESSLESYKEKIYILISKLEVFKGRSLLAGTFGLLLALGSYTYTGIHQVNTDARYYNLLSKVEAISDTASTNKTSMAVLSSQLQTTNDRLRELIDFMREAKTN